MNKDYIKNNQYSASSTVYYNKNSQVTNYFRKMSIQQYLILYDYCDHWDYQSHISQIDCQVKKNNPHIYFCLALLLGINFVAYIYKR